MGSRTRTDRSGSAGKSIYNIYGINNMYLTNPRADRWLPPLSPQREVPLDLRSRISTPHRSLDTRTVWQTLRRRGKADGGGDFGWNCGNNCGKQCCGPESRLSLRRICGGALLAGEDSAFASAVAAMKDAEILKRFLIILRLFREHVRIKYNK